MSQQTPTCTAMTFPCLPQTITRLLKIWGNARLCTWRACKSCGRATASSSYAWVRWHRHGQERRQHATRQGSITQNVHGIATAQAQCPLR